MIEITFRNGATNEYYKDTENSIYKIFAEIITNEVQRNIEQQRDWLGKKFNGVCIVEYKNV